MAVRRRFSRSSGTTARRPRRKLVWARSNNLSAGTALAAGVVLPTDLLADYQTQAGGDSLNGSTLMAIRGRFWVEGASTVAANAVTVTMGIKLCSQLDIALPAAQLLSTHAPLSTARYDDWLARDYFHVAGTATATNFSMSQEYFPLMIRSRRRIDELYSTIGMFIEGTGAASTYYFAIDCPLALP